MMYVRPDHKEIRRLMNLKGLNTYEVANRSNGSVSQPTISRLTTGKMEKAQRIKLEAVAKVLRVPVENLVKEAPSS
jgi:transcriptional regulator with XRE-family HTH domain